MSLIKTPHVTQAKCLQELINGPDLHTECWIHPILPKSGKMIFGGHAKVGKALHIDEKILLKNGNWTTAADIKPGEELASVDGQPSVVLAKEWHIKRRLFEVLFSDGTRSICADDHLWEVRSDHWRQTPEPATLMTTLEVQEWLSQPKAATTELFIPQFTGDFGTENVLPIDPYILGALIGDGSFMYGSIGMTSVDQFIVDKFRMYFGTENVRARKESKKTKPCQYGITTGGWLQQSLKDLGLYGHRSEDKFIPEIYLKTTRENRLALLQGLMDTDGTAGAKYGSLEYSTSSEQLAKDAMYLIRSLGYGCTMTSRIPTFKDRDGKSKYGLRAYRVKIHGPGQDCFQLPRKKERTINNSKFYRKKFAKVTEIGPGPAVCIEVSHPRGLFITNDFIVTHNSMIMLSIVRALTTGENALACPRFRVDEPAKVLLFEQELGEAGLQRRARTVFADANLQREIRYLSREPDVSFSTDKGFEIIGNEIADNRPNVVVIDPLGKCYTGDENSAQEVALLWQKVDRLLRLGNREQLSIILSHHFGKKVNGDRNREGYDPLDAYNFRGSSKWFDDVDSLITVNRLQNLPLPHQAWRLQTRFELRHDEVPPEMYFTVNRERDLRVRYERDVDPPQNNMSLQPIRRNNNTTDPAARR